MNILLIIPSNSGTIASVSYDLYKGLCKQPEVKVYVACLSSYKENGVQFDNVYKLGERKGLFTKMCSRILSLKRIKKENNIKISISTLLGASYWNVLSGIGEYKIGIFHARLSQMKYGGLLFYFSNYILNKVLCSRLNKLIAVNRSAYWDLKKIQGDKKNIELVYNIHNINKIREMSLLVLEDNNEKHIFENPVILYVGNLYCEIKGTDRLVKAFANVYKEFPQYRLVFVGRDMDDSMKVLNNMIDEYDLAKCVHFLGRKNNPYQYMKNAEMLVSPSRDEGLPGVLIEALSLGKKCVATNSSMGVWEIMQCDDKYDANLRDLYKTIFGVICPNDLENDDFTVNKLSEAIKTCILSKYEKMSNFDCARFSEDIIVPHFIKNN